MKALFRLTVLMLVALVFLSNVALAVTWQRVNNATGVFFDTDEICFGKRLNNVSLSVEPDFTRVICWTKTEFTPREAAQFVEVLKDFRYYSLDCTIALITLSIPDKTYTVHRYTYISTNGSIIKDIDDGYTFKILPGSWAETQYEDIVNYALANEKILTQHTMSL